MEETNEQKVAEFGRTEKSARNNLEKLLPFEPGHENYARCDITVEEMANNKYLASAVYELQSGVTVPPKKGTGPAPTLLEQAAARYI